MKFKSMTMARVVSLIGFFIGCGMLAIAVAGTPRSASVEARETDASVRAQNCHIEEVMIDEGYGSGRKEQRNICSEAD